MQSLDTGISPVVAVRMPDTLLARLDEAAGADRGARARYIRHVLAMHFERETAPGKRTRGRSSQGTTVRKATR